MDREELADELAAVPTQRGWRKGNAYSHGELVITTDLRDRILSTLRQPEHVPDARPDFIGSPEAKIESYNQAHEVALELGYPSLTEALEALADYRAYVPDAEVQGMVERLRAMVWVDHFNADGVDDGSYELRNPDGSEAADLLTRLSGKGWRTMDSAPRDGSEVLLDSGSGGIWLGYYEAGRWYGVGMEGESYLEDDEVDFWHPLPDPPTGSVGGEGR